jgi:PAS domain S-box-containing protein
MRKKSAVEADIREDNTEGNFSRDILVQKALSKYKTLFDSNMFGVAATDFKDSILSANDAFLSMIGYTREDVANGTVRWSTISPLKYDEPDLEKMNELLIDKTIVPFEKEYIHKDGHTVPVLVGAEALDDALSYGVCFALDISKLKESEQKKDDFIGMVSHELKTPLSIMKLYANFLENSIREGGSKNELLESVNEISNQVDKLSILITDLFNMARYRTSESAFPISAINVTNSVKKIVSELSLINERTIIFQGEKAVYINGNQERISQVVTNLVNNAIRYSSADTDIIVRVHHDHEKAYIHVQDSGMGIRTEDAEKIFERYYRVNHADDYSDNGSGIGLYVSSEIIKQHKGKISVESMLGKGSTFTIEFPLIKTS